MHGAHSRMAKLVLDAETRAELESIAKSRTDGQARIERAKVLPAYHGGERVTALAEAFQARVRGPGPGSMGRTPTPAPRW